MDVAPVTSSNFFEGVEKLLEVWFAQSEIVQGHGNACLISPEKWKTCLKQAKVEVLDSIEHGGQVALLLSESSMFVSRNRVILKTCGSSLCLNALPYIVQLVRDECGLDIVADCFYSRKNFMKPDHQPHPHQTFENEVIYLNEKLSSNLASYCLGQMNSDCWFLCTLNHCGNPSLIGTNQPDQTLEILMTGLDKDVMAHFVAVDENGKKKLTDQVTSDSGISRLIPDSKINAALFEPCGYSMNGLLPKGQYWTIHITPEPEFSYVSFETNLDTNDYKNLIHDVTALFKPQRFAMTLFRNHLSSVDLSQWNLPDGPSVQSYKRLDKQIAYLDQYCLFYLNFEKI